jgi:BASS family bile acid:Na+ symporter
MGRLKNLLLNRDFILILALSLGLFLGQGARWTERLVVPALAVVMTLATMGVPGGVFLAPRSLLLPAFAGVAMNYGVLGGLLLGLNFLLIRDEALRYGFIIMTAVPPAIAVIPFTAILNGNPAFTLIATIGCYLAALVLTPLITLYFIGSGFMESEKIFTLLGELILIPLILSRLLLWSKMAERVEPLKGGITNWGFFLVVYTIVGLNRDLFFAQPLAFLPAAFVALASTFLLGFIIEKTSRFFLVDSQLGINLVLLGTQKNTGLAAGLALTLFSERTAVPATVSTIFMLVYFIWLSFKQRRKGN